MSDTVTNTSAAFHSGRQYLRKARLYLESETDVMDFSALRFSFRSFSASTETPDFIQIRVWNVGRESMERAIKEFSSVTVEAGYQDGAYGMLFQGDVRQFKRGRESNIDSYLDIYAADGDLFYGFAVNNITLVAGSTAAERAVAIARSTNVSPIEIEPNSLTTLEKMGGVIPCPKVIFGMARANARDLANSGNAIWSIADGKMQVLPLDSYIPSDVVEINSKTGMIGIPEATQEGVEVTCQLNPLIRVGTLIRLNNDDIVKTSLTKSGKIGFPAPGENLWYAQTGDDGVYRVLVIEHAGDTRGTPWTSTITCLLAHLQADGTYTIKVNG